MAKSDKDSSALKNTTDIAKIALRASRSKSADEELDQPSGDDGADAQRDDEEDREEVEDTEESEDGDEVSTEFRPKRFKYGHLTGAPLINQFKRTCIELDEVRHNLADVRKTIKVKTAQVTELRKKYRSSSAQTKELNVECRDLKALNAQEKKQHEEELAKRKQNFANASQELSLKYKKSSYPLLPDDVLREKFQDLLNRCTEWVKAWVSMQVSEKLISSYKEMMSRLALTRGSSIQDTLLQKLASNDRVVLKALGLAWFSREMFRSFFESPFFACGTARLSLEVFHKGSMRKTPQKTRAWRADTTRLCRETLNVPALNVRASNIDLEGIEQICAPVVDEFLNESDAILCHDVTDEECEDRKSDLTGICHDFCLLALELWCHKSEVEIVKDAILLREPFSTTSPVLRAHMSMGVDDEDHQFDDVLPHAVLVPAIRVIGDSDGNNMWQEKILSRSIVLIHKDITFEYARALGSIDSLHHSDGPDRQQALKRRSPRKRKLSTTDSPSKRLRSTATVDLTEPSTERDVLDHVDLTRASKERSSSADILKSIERRGVTDYSDEDLGDATQETHDSSAPTESIPTSDPISRHNDRSDPVRSPTPSDLEDDKRAEDLHDKQVSPASQTEEKELSGTINDPLEDLVRNESGKISPLSEEEENGMTEEQPEATEWITS